MKTLQELIEAARKAVAEGKLDEAKALIEQAKALKTLDELAPDPEQDAKVAALEAEIADLKAFRRQVEAEAPVNDPGIAGKTVNVNTKTKRGDDEVKAVAHYVRTGDVGAVKSLKASNDTDMNVGTPADGGYAVPTGHYQGIIAKRNETMLRDKLGVLMIPGKGTTVNVPYDNGAANVFVSTNEAAGFDRDAPVLNQHAMTLVKYTKKIELSDELLEDEDSRILDFLDDFVGRALALTHNSALVTAALAGGTSVALGAAAAATATDIPRLVYALADEYGDNAQWVMRRATEGKYREKTGDNWQFMPMPQGGGRNELWGAPINHAAAAPAIGAGLKSVIFGNFGYMGYREAPRLTFLRDPFSGGATGQVKFYYYTRFVYKVLQAEAIVYGTHPTA